MVDAAWLVGHGEDGGSTVSDVSDGGAGSVFAVAMGEGRAWVVAGSRCAARWSRRVGFKVEAEARPGMPLLAFAAVLRIAAAITRQPSGPRPLMAHFRGTAFEMYD